MPTYSIIIPTYNNFELNLRCISSILKNSSPFKIEIIIIDNGSVDKTLAWAQELHTQKIIRLVSSHNNMVFYHACNQGALIADGNYIIFLNNGTEILPCWLQGLQNFFKSDQNIGVIGEKLLYQNNTIQHAGIEFDKKKYFIFTDIFIPHTLQ